MYFEYPIDTKSLIRKKKQIKRDLLTGNSDFVEKRLAIFGGSTTGEIADQIELFLLHYGIKVQIYQSEYGKYREDALFGNPELDAFQPDIVYIHTNWRNISSFPSLSNSSDEVCELLNQEFQRFVEVWDAIESRYHCPIIQNNFDRPNFRLLGNKDISDIHGRTNFITRLNQRMYKYSQEHSNLLINDLDYLSADYGLSDWADASYWHMYKYAMCLDAIPIVASSVAKIIKAIYGKNKKALVLDLDNTLWGGVIGDDGVEGIAIGPDTPSGQVYSEFQTYCKAQTSIGVILGINSKNEEYNALAGLNHPDSVLRPDDFVSIKANWESKDGNIIEMANELSLGVDSFVFVDDNPAEREIVLKQIPTVSVPEVGKIESFIRIIDHEGYFEVINLSDEDAKKTEMYHAKVVAAKAVAAYSDYGEYLDSLEMKATIKTFEDIYIQRISQLTNKSNQFNLTTLRCTEDDIRKMSESDFYITMYGKLEDKFGDNGVVSAVVGKIVKKELHIKLWIMSCRVLKRGLEDVMLNALVDRAISKGIDTIYGYYYPTAKNGIVKEFYHNMQFHEIASEDIGTKWKLVTDEYIPIHTHIEIK